jgi:hypothetical protein
MCAAILARRLPELKDAPVSESRVCQYENTSNGDFLIDRHPELRMSGSPAAVQATASSMVRLSVITWRRASRGRTAGNRIAV